MAPTHTVVAAVAVHPVRESELIRRVAKLLVRIQPHKKTKKVVIDLRNRLETERREREAAGLNHWSEHAPHFLASVVQQARAERLRRHAEAAELRRTKHAQIVRVAALIVGDVSAAEAVASETYRELMLGIATLPGFFQALICNARNYLAADLYREGRFVSLEDAFLPAFAGVGEPDVDGGECISTEPASLRSNDQDPLDILIAREDAVEREQLVQKAKEIARWNRDFRWIRAKDWAKDLGIMAVA